MPSTPVNRPIRFSSALARCADPRMASPSAATISRRTFLLARSGSQDAPNKGALFRGRFLGDEIVLSDQRFRFGEPRIGIVADGGERLAFLDAIADALV